MAKAKAAKGFHTRHQQDERASTDRGAFEIGAVAALTLGRPSDAERIAEVIRKVRAVLE